MKKHLRTFGTFALAAVFLLIAFWNTDFPALWKSLRSANYWWLIPAMIFVPVSMVFRAFRWRCLLSPLKKIGFADLFSAINICFMANNFLPARAGEVIRAVLIGRKHRVKISTVLATVLLERIFDALCVIALFILLILIHTVDPVWKTRGLWLSVIYLFFLLLLVLMRIYSAAVQRGMHRFLSSFSSRFAHKACAVIDSFLQGLNVLKEWKQVSLILLHTFFIWTSIFLTYYFVCYAFGVQMVFAGYLLLLCFLVIAVMAPIPGYWGSFHVAFKEALEVFKYGSAVARSCALVAHGSQYICITLLGVLSLRYENISFGELKKREKEAEEELGG